ncbi:MAG: UDP-N-acetylglucosamine pyrophosphorylase [Clostridia bacterium]|nr:UDP-N-acetylglucosamine pyrophosphorylase [Clostridia bacterium]
MIKKVKTAELFECDIPYIAELLDGSEYPWEILPKIKSHIEKLIAEGLDGFTEIQSGVWVGHDVKISPTATVIPPVVIGHGTEIRVGAFLRGNVIIGEGCVVGNSCELKNCLLMRGAQVPHYNYVGDSVLGNFSHMGAGAVCSNLKSDGKAVVVHGDRDYATGLRKMGAILGDHADIGCGCVLNPGTVVGKNTSVYPLTSLRGVIPADCIVKSTDNTVKRK